MQILSGPLATKFAYKKRSEKQRCRVTNDLDLIFAVELRPPTALLLSEAAPGGVEAKQAKQRTQVDNSVRQIQRLSLRQNVASQNVYVTKRNCY